MTYDEKKLWPIFSKFIRLRDAQPFTGLCKCFTCPRIKHWTKGDCGHGIPRQHKATKYHEKNNHFQCKHCNGFEGGRREVYKANVDKKYGEHTWDMMELASRQVCKMGKFEYDELAIHYKKEVDRIIREKHL